MKQIKIKTNLITLIINTLFVVILFSSITFSQQITGLSGWNIYLDPGHSGVENMGIYNYSEAEKNLGVALNLRQMLLDWTDIDTVYICRTDGNVVVGLTQRTDQANALGAAHYHSIHSDAGGVTSNSTLIMWGQMGIGGPEKTPYGGKRMSQIMVGLLTAGMRTNTRGAMGDRDFYQVDNPYPYLSVNRNSTMASELSEAGFHTNPTQNQLNMNEQWKRLEAKTMFWTILKYRNVARPYAGTVVGIIKDTDTGLPVNGAVVTLDGQTYTTDTWASLFHKYSSDSTLLRNGFYYFENISSGSHELKVTANGFDDYTANVTAIDTFFTFKDINLISNVPLSINSTIPNTGDSLYPGVDNISINFNKPVNKSTIDSNIIIEPNVSASFGWSNGDRTLLINTTNFAFDTTYHVTLKANITDIYGHALDGNGDGTGGDDFVLNVKTKVQDNTPPSVIGIYPEENATDVEVRPVINISFSEPLKTATVSSRIKVVKNSDQTNASYLLRYYIVNGKSVLNLFISTPLAENESYTVKVMAGVEDVFGNPTTIDFNFDFATGGSNYVLNTSIDNFETSTTTWWQPQQSGTTTGILTNLTSASSVTTIMNHNTGSTRSELLRYGYDTTASNWLIRFYNPATSPSFDNLNLLQAFIFGDGNNNKFRFALRETSITDSASYEVSPWYNVDWIGWKLVTWDLSKGETGSWHGNGILEPPFNFDSFQFTYVPGNVNSGSYYIDDLRIATFSPTAVEKEDSYVPNNFKLEQNYPNPFNPSTTIKFSLPKTSNVKIIISNILGKELETLVNDNLNAGNYSVNFNANGLASGVYFYTIITDNFKQSRKMILMK